MEESRVDPDTGFLLDPLPPWYFSKNELPSPKPRAQLPPRESPSYKGKEKAETVSSPNGDSGRLVLSYLDFGQRVRAKWSNGQFYEATVTQINRDSDTVQVVYDDGLTEILPLDSIQIIPSELMISGSGRRLRSVDAKLEEEMKTMTGSRENRPKPSSSSSSSSSSAPSTPKPRTPAPTYTFSESSSATGIFRRVVSKQPKKKLQFARLPLRKTLIGRPLTSSSVDGSNSSRLGLKIMRMVSGPKSRTHMVVLPSRLSNGRFATLTPDQKAKVKEMQRKALQQDKTPIPKSPPAVGASPTSPNTPQLRSPKLSPRVVSTPLGFSSPVRTPGTWIWGKMTVHGVTTWYPAEVVDPGTPKLPQTIARDREIMLAKGNALISFIEKGGQRTLAWHPERQLLKFGSRRLAVRRIKKLDQYTKDLVMDAYDEALKHSPAGTDDPSDDEDDDDEED